MRKEGPESSRVSRPRPHVLFLAAWYPDEGRPAAGVFIREHALAVSLFCDVSVLHIQVRKAPLGVRSEMKVTRPSESLTEFRLTINTPLRRFGFHDRLVRSAASQAIERLRSEREVDLYHIHVRDHITKLLPDLNALAAMPFLLTEHWSFYHTGINALPREEQDHQEKEIARWFSHPGLRLICPVSEDLSRILVKRFKAPLSKMRVIPNVANELFQPAGIPSPQNKTRLALVGLWHEPKNPMLFVEALSNLGADEARRFEIAWIGDGPQMEAVRNLVQRDGLTHIKLLGMQPKAVVAETLRSSDYLIHPTDAENLPCIIIESLSCGTPVVSMRVNGVPELVDDSNGVLIDAKDVGQMTDVLRGMLNGKYNFNREVISGNARGRFSASAIGAQYMRCYQEILAGRV